MTQTERIKQHIEKYGSITSREAFLLYGCTRLSARMYDLKCDGFRFTTEFEKGKNKYGEAVSWVKYKKSEKQQSC